MLKRLAKQIMSVVLLKPLTARVFHILYYHSSDLWPENQFLGFPILQSPMDLQLYQEIIYALRPECIIQTGVARGGSILYFASLLDMIKAPPDVCVVGIDIALSEKSKTIVHPRVKLIEGDSVAASTIDAIKAIVGERKGLVALDSDHSEAHVSKEIALYQRFVAERNYMVVEDTNINGHPVAPFSGPGPYEAVQKFLKSTRSFRLDDLLWKKNMFSFHQWLKRAPQG